MENFYYYFKQISLSAIIMLALAVTALAQKIPFQGKLLETGVPVNGPRDFVFSIPSISWTESQFEIQVSNGLYSVVLGSIEPLPADLFSSAASHQLSITVGGQSIGSVDLYAAFTKPNFTMDAGTAPTGKDASSITLTGTGTNGQFYRAIVGTASVLSGFNQGVTGLGIASSGTSNTTYGVVGRATGQGTGIKMGVYGFAESQEGNSQSHYGLYGIAQGSGTGTHFGLTAGSSGTHDNFGGLLTANGIGKYNVGARGFAHGAGNGETGFENGSYNNGIQGFARGNTWGNTGVYGYVYNNSESDGPGVDNNGVVGLSKVGISGNTTVSNVGVRGRAEGPGINKGVVGNASGGVENWAGWFDGNVMINGDLEFTGGGGFSLPDTVDGSFNNGDPLGTVLTVVADGPGGTENVAFSALSRAETGVNTGLWAKAFGPASNSSNQYAIYGQSDALGNGWSSAVTGDANGSGTGPRYGVRGDVRGANSIFSAAVRGYNYGIPNENGMIWGGYFTKGATDDPTPTATNIGLEGRSLGNGGTNIGVKGAATGGNTNWAGWFEGDVKVTGSLIVNGDFDVPAGELNVTDANSKTVVSATHTGNNTGLITIKSTSDSSRVDIKHNSQDIRGIDSEANVILGYNWSSGGSQMANRGGIYLFADTLERLQTGVDIRRIDLVVADDGFGKSVGRLSLGGPIADSGPHNEPYKPFVQMGGKTPNGTSYFGELILQGQLGKNVEITAADSIGKVFLYDNLGNEHARLTGRKVGGYAELKKLDANGYIESAVTLSSNNLSSGINTFTRKKGTTDQIQNMVNIYNTGVDPFLNSYTGGYRRAGIDFYDNEGTRLAAIGSARDENGTDPEGKSGLLLLWGTNSANVELTGKRWSDADLPHFRLMGKNSDGNGWWQPNVMAEVNEFESMGYGNFKLSNTRDGNPSGINGIFMTSNYLETEAGGIELRDADDQVTIVINGADGTVTASNISPSDARLKTNILPLNNALRNVLNMRGVSYNWTDTNKSDKLQIGVIAQEVEAIYPEFVHTDDKGMKAVNYSQMVAVLIEAIKEMNAKIVALETENANLKASLTEIGSMKQQIKNLETMMVKLASGATNEVSTSQQDR